MELAFNIFDFLDRAANVFPDRCAIVDEGQVAGSFGRITYQEMRARAYGLALALDACGLKVGDRVGIVSPNAARFLIALFAVSGSGRILVPINYRLQFEEINFIADDSSVSLLLVDPEVVDRTRQCKCPCIVMDGVADAALFEPASATALFDFRDELAPASINYTSGTTGKPKGVILTHRNCWTNAMAMGWQLGINQRDVYLHTLPTFHCNGWGVPYATAAMGCRQVIQRTIDGEEILSRIASECVTLLCAAPAVLSRILDAAKARAAQGQDIPGAGVVRIVGAGAPPPAAVIDSIDRVLGWEFIHLYGLTETSPLVALNRAPLEWDGLAPAERARRLASAGPPGIGVQIMLAEDGEILTRSNHVFAGYWNDSAATAAVMGNGWLHTGDGGEFSGTQLRVVDRKKDIVITGGENVASAEVEDCLFDHPEIAEACVIAVPHEKWGETVKALVVLRPAAAVGEAELIEFCRSRLSHFKCPTSIEIRSSLPRTATGKLQKAVLRAPYWSDRERTVN